jgi:hypothetical protein
MRRLWKGLLLGAVVGGVVKTAQEVRGEDGIDDVALAVGKTAGQVALAGAAVGFLLDRRARRKRSRLDRARAAAKSKVSLGAVLAGAGALADVALPALHTAADHARPAIHSAAERARPAIHSAADAAKAKLADIDLPAIVAA